MISQVIDFRADNWNSRKTYFHGLVKGVDGKAAFRFLVADVVNAVFKHFSPSRYQLGQEAILFRITFFKRFLYSLSLFERSLSNIRKSGETSRKKTMNKRDCEVAAQLIFYFSGVMMDSLARIIPFFFNSKHTKEIESMGKLKQAILCEGYLPSLQPLFKELNKRNSWWSIGFSHKHGYRQRFTHYSHNFLYGTKVSLSSTKSGRRWAVDDFEAELRVFLFEMCKWLDILFLILRPLLEKKYNYKKRKNPSAWGDKTITFSDYCLPIFLIPPPHSTYLYLPFCDKEYKLIRSRRIRSKSIRGLLKNGRTLTVKVQNVGLTT